MCSRKSGDSIDDGDWLLACRGAGLLSLLGSASDGVWISVVIDNGEFEVFRPERGGSPGPEGIITDIRGERDLARKTIELIRGYSASACSSAQSPPQFRDSP